MARTKASKKKSNTENTDQRDNIIDNTENAPETTPGRESKESTAAKMNVERLGEDVPGAMADTTASPADEEGERDGKDVLGEEEEELDIVMGTEADVTEDDLTLLGDRDQDQDLGEDELIQTEGLDDTDAEGDPLNEAASDIDTTGEDLDFPEEEVINPHSAADQDDEENDYYSLGGERKDDDDDGTPQEYRNKE